MGNNRYSASLAKLPTAQCNRRLPVGEVCIAGGTVPKLPQGFAPKRWVGGV